mgnify:CR=1 FL=1
MSKTFRNLKFRPKKYDKKCIGATLELKPKVFLSVVAGPGLYSSPGGIGKNRDDFDEEFLANTVAEFYQVEKVDMLAETNEQ